MTSEEAVGKAALKKARGPLAGSLVSMMAVQATLVVTGVVTARALGVEGRGIFALVTLVSTIGGIAGGLGIPYALSFVVAREPERVVSAVTSSARMVLVPGLVMMLVGASLVLAAGEGSLAAAITALSVVTTIMLELCLATWQGLKQFTPYNLMRPVPNSLFAIVLVPVWIWADAALAMVLCLWGASRLIAGILCLLMQRRRLRGERLPEQEERRLRTFGLKSILGAASPVETFRLDQALVAILLSRSDLGLYAAALAFTNFPRFLAQAIGSVAAPFVASAPGEERVRLMWRITLITIPIYLIPILLLILVSPRAMTLLFGEEFETAGSIAQIMLAGTAAYSGRRVLSDCGRSAGYPTATSKAEVVSLGASIVLGAGLGFLAGGLSGIAYGLAAGSLVALAYLLLALRRAVKVPPTWLPPLSMSAAEVTEQ